MPAKKKITRLMRVDHIVFDGDSYDLGGVTVQVIRSYTMLIISLINQKNLFASDQPVI